MRFWLRIGSVCNGRSSGGCSASTFKAPVTSEKHWCAVFIQLSFFFHDEFMAVIESSA
jgi:hypothetical protein